MRGKGLGLVAAVGFLLVAVGAMGVEKSMFVLERADKAILVPAGELGQVTIYAEAEPTSSEARRHRYTYTVYYREGFPSVVPFSTYAEGSAVPLVGFDVMGDPDCDFASVGRPNRRVYGPWTWGIPAPGTLAYTTPSRRWRPTELPLVFTFTSACAPGVGSAKVRMTHGEDAEEAYALGSRLLAPMKPPVRTAVSPVPPAPPGRNYARPSRRR